jgi:hypothetical protein
MQQIHHVESLWAWRCNRGSLEDQNAVVDDIEIRPALLYPTRDSHEHLLDMARIVADDDTGDYRELLVIILVNLRG